MPGQAALASLSPPAFPANNKIATPSADARHILRQNEQAERQHPETDDREKSESPANDQRRAEPNASGARRRHGELAVEHPYRVSRRTPALAAFLRPVDISHRPKPLSGADMPGMRLFPAIPIAGTAACKKVSFTAWQIGKTFDIRSAQPERFSPVAQW